MSRLPVPPAPRSPTRARIARSLFERGRRTAWSALEVIAPRRTRAAPATRRAADGDHVRRVLPPAGSHPARSGSARRTWQSEWRSDDLAGVLSAFATRLTSLVPRPLQRLRRLYEPLQPGHERNTPDGARANISRHYDLSNELFATFLTRR